MPSLILERVDKNDDRRKDETENWIEKLESRFEIEKQKYINIEVVFRQLVMHEKMATGFVYENDEPFPLNKNLKEKICPRAFKSPIQQRSIKGTSMAICAPRIYRGFK